MDLILWRHAEAVDGSPDMARTLTAKGEKQAKETAAWLHARLPKRTRVLVSPAERALRTARALTDEFEVVKSIAPGASPAAVLAAAGWPDAGEAVLVVGHQPTLGMVAAMLIAGEPMPWSIRKSGLWWLSHRVRGEEPQVVVRAVMAPDLL
ncbi:MAG TPA: histidine phosphatase family protein [Burkholderiales bacterium]|jgi:phosphohistidine phosphatase|nr:histidine phosphatase family protein [Burkholderiales bacterium]